MDPPNLFRFNQAYEQMISSLDDVDRLAGEALRDSNPVINTQLKKSIDVSIKDYDIFLQTVDAVVILYSQ